MNLRFLLLLFLSLSVLYAEAVKSQKPIQIILNDWSSQIVLSKVLGRVYESVGYRVEYPFYTVEKQFGAMNLGWAHVQVEIWEGTMLEDFEYVSKKSVVRAGVHDAKTREEWWYPSYVKALCPGLPDWRALKQCSHIFATEESQGKGVYMGGPWEKPDAQMVRALGLDFIIKTAKDSDELTRYIEAAYAEKRPIVVFNWTPNWTELVYEGEFVEFPLHTEACENDPAWGENSFFTHDCGNPKDALLFKGAWKGMESEWPCAFEILKNMNLTNEMVARAAYLVDVKHMSYDEAAEAWFEHYADKVKEWIPETCSR